MGNAIQVVGFSDSPSATRSILLSPGVVVLALLALAEHQIMVVSGCVVCGARCVGTCGSVFGWFECWLLCTITTDCCKGPAVRYQVTGTWYQVYRNNSLLDAHLYLWSTT